MYLFLYRNNMVKRKRTTVTRSKIPKSYKRKKIKTNKQLTRGLRSLKKLHAIKAHYVDIDNVVVSQLTPIVVALTGIGAGDGNNQHESDWVKLRGLNVHGRCTIGNSGDAPTINGPRQFTALVVSSSLGTGLGETPSFDNLFRDTGITETNFPLTQSFRTLYAESTTQVKILARRDFMMEPHGPQAVAAAQSYPTMPSCVNFKMAVPVRNTKINYRPGTSTTVNKQLFLMLYCNSGGAGADSGIKCSGSSKLSYYDGN